jgi:hypothetical protein
MIRKAVAFEFARQPSSSLSKKLHRSKSQGVISGAGPSLTIAEDFYD